MIERTRSTWLVALAALLVAISAGIFVIVSTANKDRAQQATEKVEVVRSSASVIESQGQAAATQASLIKDAAGVFVSSACPHAQATEVLDACRELGYVVSAQESVVSVGGTATPEVITRVVVEDGRTVTQTVSQVERVTDQVTATETVPGERPAVTTTISPAARPPVTVTPAPVTVTPPAVVQTVTATQTATSTAIFEQVITRTQTVPTTVPGPTQTVTESTDHLVVIPTTERTTVTEVTRETATERTTVTEPGPTVTSTAPGPTVTTTAPTTITEPGLTVTGPTTTVPTTVTETVTVTTTAPLIPLPTP